MTCLECGSEMKTSLENYRYDESGLPYVVLTNVEVSRCLKCGLQEVAIDGLDDLHRFLAQAVAMKNSRLTPEEVRFLRKYLGYSSSDFAEIVGVAPETVSRWENGGQVLKSVADRLIRMLALSMSPATAYPIDHSKILEWLRKIDENISEPVRVEAKREGHEWEPVGTT